MQIIDVDNKIILELRKSGLSKEMKSLEFCKFLIIEKDGKNINIMGAGGVGGLFNVPSLQIGEEFQGKGLGKILLKATIDEAKKRKYSFISGSRNPKNSRAIKLHDYFGFKPIFRIHYSPEIIRDVIILVLSPKGKIVAKFLGIFNNKFGMVVLGIMVRITKSLFREVLTLEPNEFRAPDIMHMIKNFEKLP